MIIILLFGRRNATFIYYNLIHILIITLYAARGCHTAHPIHHTLTIRL